MSFPLVSILVLVVSVISTSAFTNTAQNHPSLHQAVQQINSGRHHNQFSPLRSSNTSDNNAVSESKVLVLGGSGFVGQHVIDALNLKEIPFIATSKRSQDDTIALDLTSDTAAQQVLELCASNDISTVVSTVGSIFTECDYEVNAASGQIAKALSSSKDVNVDKFIFIGNSQRIRNVCKTVPSLQEYARGKEESEQLIQQIIDADDRLHCCIVRPTFIYGGDEFGWNPPRLPTKFGEIIEALLGLYPVQALSEFLPDVLGVVLEAPSNVEAVAGSIVSVVVGLDDSSSFGTREDIIMAASRRPHGTSQIDSDSAQTRREELKLCLSQHATEYTPEENFAMLEELEKLKPSSTRPTDDSSLNDRWDFCFDVEPDVGTGFIKDLFEGGGDGFMRRILDFQGVHMEIGNDQSTIQLVVSISLFQNPITVILHTSLVPAPSNPEGTMFLEKFEGVEVNGIRLWYPNAWKKSRFLEFSYLDDAFAVARGAGGEPHFLLRGNNQH